MGSRFRFVGFITIGGVLTQSIRLLSFRLCDAMLPTGVGDSSRSRCRACSVGGGCRVGNWEAHLKP